MSEFSEGYQKALADNAGVLDAAQQALSGVPAIIEVDGAPVVVIVPFAQYVERYGSESILECGHPRGSLKDGVCAWCQTERQLQLYAEMVRQSRAFADNAPFPRKARLLGELAEMVAAHAKTVENVMVRVAGESRNPALISLAQTALELRAELDNSVILPASQGAAQRCELLEQLAAEMLEIITLTGICVFCQSADPHELQHEGDCIFAQIYGPITKVGAGKPE